MFVTRSLYPVGPSTSIQIRSFSEARASKAARWRDAAISGSFALSARVIAGPETPTKSHPLSCRLIPMKRASVSTDSKASSRLDPGKDEARYAKRLCVRSRVAGLIDLIVTVDPPGWWNIWVLVRHGPVPQEIPARLLQRETRGEGRQTGRRRLQNVTMDFYPLTPFLGEDTEKIRSRCEDMCGSLPVRGNIRAGRSHCQKRRLLE